MGFGIDALVKYEEGCLFVARSNVSLTLRKEEHPSNEGWGRHSQPSP